MPKTKARFNRIRIPKMYTTKDYEGCNNILCGGLRKGQVGVEYKTVVNVGEVPVIVSLLNSGFPRFISLAQYQQFLIRNVVFFLYFSRKILRRYPITSDNGVLPNPSHFIVYKNLSIYRYRPITPAFQQSPLNYDTDVVP